MKIRLLCTAATSLLFASLTAVAQPVDPLQSSGTLRNPASRLRPELRLLSPSEASTSIAAAGFSHPVQPLLPQVAVPLGQGDSTRAARTAATRRPQAAEVEPSAAALGDAVATCESVAGDGMRAVCLDRVAKLREQEAASAQ